MDSLKSKGKIIYTIGHSNRSIEEFIDILKHYNISWVIDVRRFPTSRKFPHFTRENLKTILRSVGIKYVWLGDSLGGYRGYIRGASSIKCFKAQGYRNYAAYMQTRDWQIGFEKVVEIANKSTATIMCSERIPWRCHRKLISDALLVRGFTVIHIIEKDHLIHHKLTKCARIGNNNTLYYV
ncbi:MAG: DUF488 domain-containing protein [Candidatus Njordarchaeales archaeon]